jgi:hypothetical protein
LLCKPKFKPFASTTNLMALNKDSVVQSYIEDQDPGPDPVIWYGYQYKSECATFDFAWSVLVSSLVFHRHECFFACIVFSLPPPPPPRPISKKQFFVVHPQISNIDLRPEASCRLSLGSRVAECGFVPYHFNLTRTKSSCSL